MIGAGVAINLASVLHRGEHRRAGASSCPRPGAPRRRPAGSLAPGADSINTFKAAAASGAGGGDVGVAGAFALNLVDLKSLALLRYEAAHGPPTVNANNGAVTL